MLSIAASLCVYWYTWIRLDTAYDAPVRQWYVPLALFPEETSDEELSRAMDELCRPPRRCARDLRGCTLTGYFITPWKPSRLLLWVFLRWPLECEYWHWKQTCAQDTCDGIRSERLESWGSFDLDVRCDESEYIYGPLAVLDYRCRADGPHWAVCSNESLGGAARVLHPPFQPGMIDDVPCAEPWMVEARRRWKPQVILLRP